MNNKNKIIGIVVLVMIVIFFAVHKNAPEGKKKVEIGVISILSGQFGALGENYVKGIQLAKSQYETAHPNTQVELVVEDDAFDTKKGIAAFKKLTAVDHIDGLINVSTPTINAVHGDIVGTQLPTIQFGIQSDGLAKDSIFQISPMADTLIKSLGEYLKENTQFKKVAVVYENGDIFETFYKKFIEGYGTDHVTVMKLADKSYIQTFATNIVKEKYDSVVILGLPETGALLVKKVTTLTKDYPTFVIDAQLQTGFEDYKRILGNINVLNGTYSAWLAPGNDSKFKESFKEMYKSEPGMFADFGYDSFNVLMSNYNIDSGKWISGIQNTHIDGATGKIGFDENGVRTQDIEIKRITNGEIGTIKKIEVVK